MFTRAASSDGVSGEEEEEEEEVARASGEEDAFDGWVLGDVGTPALDAQQARSSRAARRRSERPGAS